MKILDDFIIAIDKLVYARLDKKELYLYFEDTDAVAYFKSEAEALDKFNQIEKSLK